MITVEQVISATLAHPTSPIQYDFHPQGELVAVVHTTKRSHSSYQMSRDEARLLWLKLISKGYERW